MNTYSIKVIAQILLQKVIECVWSLPLCLLLLVMTASVSFHPNITHKSDLLRSH